jgi:hypothetical protein
MRARLIVCVAVAAMLATSCVIPKIEGSGNIETETREVSGFDRIAVSHMGEIYLTQGETEGLTVRADDNLLEYIVTEVRGGTLKLGVTKKAAMAMLRPTEPIVFEISLRELSGLAVSGSASIRMPRLTTDHLEISISGSSDIDIDELAATEVYTAISGSGEVILAGEAETQTIDVSGSGSYVATDLVTRDGGVSVSGSGVVALHATDQLSIAISGSGTVEYMGNPEISHSISGSGSLARIGSSEM